MTCLNLSKWWISGNKSILHVETCSKDSKVLRSFQKSCLNVEVSDSEMLTSHCKKGSEKGLCVQ